MSFPRYPAYKDSGVPWLGEVPTHWAVTRLKFVARVQTGVAKGKDSADKDTITVPYLRVANVQDGYFDLDDVAYIEIPSDDLTRYALQAGDVLMNEGGDFDKLGRGHVWNGCINPCIHQNHVFAVRPREVSSSWLNRITGSAYAQFYFMSRSKQSTNLASISSTNVMELPVVRPPADEQAAIDVFLDRETAKIDALVAEQEQLITLLKEKRQAVISHAVTKGLNPSAPMKDSGVEWLGEVPAHWEVASLKRHWTATDCKHVTAEFVDDGIPLASIREVQSRWVDLSEAKRTTDHFYNLLIDGGRDPRPGDLIFSRNATVGEVAQVHSDHPPFAMGQDVVLLRRIEAASSSDFLQLVIRSPVVMQQLAVCMIGSTFKRINVEEIRSLVIAFPPRDEQRMISAYVLDQAGQFDRLIDEAVLSIELLRERRAALISAAVTGQIDVREAA